MKYFVTVNGREHEVELDDRPGSLRVSVDGKPLDFSFQEVGEFGQVVAIRDGKSVGLSIEGDASKAAVTIAGHFYEVRLEDERERAAHAAEGSSARRGGVVHSVMPGIVVEILVQRGQTVEKGQPLLILSAMKMQNEIGAPAAGVVTELHVSAAQAVSAGTRLVTLTVP